MSDNNQLENDSTKINYYAPEIRKMLEDEGAAEYPVMKNLDKSTDEGLMQYAALSARHSAYNLLDVCIRNYYGFCASDAKAIWKTLTSSLKTLPKFSAVIIEEIKKCYDYHTKKYLKSSGYIGLYSPCEFWNKTRILSPITRALFSVLSAYGIPAVTEDGIVYSPDFTKYGVAVSSISPKEDDKISQRTALAFNSFSIECERISEIFTATKYTSRISIKAEDFGENVGWSFILLPRTCFHLDKQTITPEIFSEELEYNLEFKRRVLDNVPSDISAITEIYKTYGFTNRLFKLLSEKDKVTYTLLFGNGEKVTYDEKPIEIFEEEGNNNSFIFPEFLPQWDEYELKNITQKKRRWDNCTVGKLKFLTGLRYALRVLNNESEVFKLLKALLSGWTRIHSWKVPNEEIDMENDNVSVLYKNNTVFRILSSVLNHPLSLSDIPDISGLFDERVELALITSLKNGVLESGIPLKRLYGWTSPLITISKQTPEDDNVRLDHLFPKKKTEELADYFVAKP